MKLFFFLFFFSLFFSLSSGQECEAYASDFGSDIYKAFQSVSSCYVAYIGIDINSRASQEIIGDPEQQLYIIGLDASVRTTNTWTFSGFGAISFQNVNFLTNNVTGDAYSLRLRCPAIIDRCLFQNNGGGIWSNDVLLVNNSYFIDNFNGAVGSVGGGIYNEYSLSVSNSYFSQNGAVQGGAIASNDVDLHNCEFEDNLAFYGGAVSSAGFSSIESCTFKRNTGNDLAGAIYASKIQLSNSTFVDNGAQIGGAIYAEKPSMIESCKFSTNSASLAGGAIFNDLETVSVIGCTFEDNIAKGASGSSTGKGAAIYAGIATISKSNFIRGNSNSASVYITKYINESSNLFLNNTGGAIMLEYADGVFAHSIYENNWAGSQPYGGSAIALLSNVSSSLIDNCTFNRNYNQDLLGGAILVFGYLNITNSRFMLNYAEVGGAIYIDSIGADINNCTFLNNTYATGSRGFGGAVYARGSINVYQSWFENNSAKNGGAIFGRETINSISSIYISNNAEGPGGAIGSSAVNARNCRFISNAAFDNGGGIFALKTSTIEDSFFDSNIATNGGGAAASDLNVNGSIFVNNFGTFAGALYANYLNLSNSLIKNSTNSGSVYISYSMTGFNTTFESNLSEGNGGGIATQGSLYLTNMTFVNNTADQIGGAIYNIGATTSEFVFINCIFERNTAKVGGGAIGMEPVVDDTRVLIQNCTSIENNSNGNGGFFSFTNNFASIEIRDLISTTDTSNSYGSVVSVISSSAQGNVSITNGRFYNGESSLGGSLFFSGDFTSLRFKDLIFEDNLCLESAGGAISLRINSEEVLFYDCIFRGNKGIQGSTLILQDSSHVQNLLFERVTISHNEASVGGSVTFGGTMKELNIRSSNISNNIGTVGSGLEIQSQVSLLKIQDSHFGSNIGTSGSAIYANPKVGTIKIQVEDSSFDDNRASQSGGAIYFAQSVESSFQNSNFSNNYAANGGVIYSTVPLTNLTTFQSCYFNSNAASNEGGAVYAIFSNGYSSSFVVDSLFQKNSAQKGGAISILTVDSNKRKSDSRVEIAESFFLDNSAQSLGGGISAIGDLHISSCSFQGNGQGIYMENGTISTEDSSFQSSQIYLSPSSVLVGPTGMSSLLNCNTGQQVSEFNGTYSCINSITTQGQNVLEITKVANVPLIVGLVVGIGGFILITAILVAIFLYRKQQRAKLQVNSFSMIDFSTIDLGESKKSIIDFDSIKVIKEVGAGAFGIVYEAEWRGLIVAVKQIRSEHVTKEQLKDFLQEVAILKGLRSHPNVVMFLGITFPPQPLSLVTEFCEGGSLYSYLRENECIQSVKMSLIIGIAKGMLHLHKEGVIHRDLAVRNILLSKHLEPKISDFGLSREHADTDTAATTNTLVGPLKWMSPEAILSQQYSIKSDAFSFGVVIWEILEVEDPWSKFTPVEAALKVAKEGERLSIPEGADHKITEIIKGCFEEDPAKRPNFDQICSLLEGEVQNLDDTKVIKSIDSETNDSHYAAPTRPQNDSYSPFPNKDDEFKKEDDYQTIPDNL